MISASPAIAYSPALASMSGIIVLAAVEFRRDHVGQLGIGQAAEQRERVLRQLASHVSGQVREASAMIGEDVEDAVVAVGKADREPCDGLRLRVDARLGALEKLLDVRFVA